MSVTKEEVELFAGKVLGEAFAAGWPHPSLNSCGVTEDDHDFLVNVSWKTGAGVPYSGAVYFSKERTIDESQKRPELVGLLEIMGLEISRIDSGVPT